MGGDRERERVVPAMLILDKSGGWKEKVRESVCIQKVVLGVVAECKGAL